MKKVIFIGFFCIIYFIGLISSVQAFRFAIISDTRAGSLDNALEFIQSREAEFIVLPGDFFYDGQDYYSHFVKFGFEVTPENGVDQQNLYFAIGNHDAPPSGDPVFVNRIAPYYPKNGPVLSPEGTVFSFDRENCHFVITNQYWDYPSGGYTEEQLDWIDQDLSVSTQPFKFVLGHEPAFAFKRHVGDSLDADPGARDAFWSILALHKVTAYLCGHSHYLSHIKKDGVYQVDAGEVRGYHLCVTLVDVGEDTALIRSYKTSGAIPVAEAESPEENDLVFETQISCEKEMDDESGIEYLYGAGPGGDSENSDEWISGCFIAHLTDEFIYSVSICFIFNNLLR